jgi:hypothetical protein
MNCTRQTAIDALDKLTDKGLIYCVRKQRVGSKYLVLPGLTKSQIVDGLMTYFSLSQQDADEALADINDRRNKSRNRTSQNKSRNRTRKVQKIDQKKSNPQTVTVNTVIEPSSKDGVEQKPEAATPNLFRTIQSDLVELAFNGNAAQYGSAGDLAHVVLGNSEKVQYQQWNVAPPLLDNEWKAIKQWWGDKRNGQGEPLNWTRSAQGLNQMVHDFRTSPDSAKYLNRIDAPEQSADPTAHELAMAAAIAATQQESVA